MTLIILFHQKNASLRRKNYFNKSDLTTIAAAHRTLNIEVTKHVTQIELDKQINQHSS